MGLLIFIGVWALCAWGGWQVGKTKGREELGLILGLLLGVIGILIVAIVPPKTDSR